MTKHLDNATVPNKRKDMGSNRFAKKDNKGIEWNHRTRSTYRHPFLKIYHKGIESKHSKNNEFFNRYLELDSIDNVARIEATIKNFSEQGIKYGLKDNTLISLLKLSSNELHNIIEHSITSNLEQRIKIHKPKTMNEYTPTELVLYQALCYTIDKGETIDSVIIAFIDSLEGNSKSRMKKKLYKIYESEIKGEIAEVKSRNMNAFFDAIGWK